MLKSMTGYGRKEITDENKKIVIDIKSVNHRYTDISVKLPRAYGYAEDKIRDFVASGISRGKVDIFVYIEFYTSDNKLVMLDRTLCKNYFDILNEIKNECGIKEDIKLSDISSFRDIFVAKEVDEDKEKICAMLLDCLKPAFSDFLAMRMREGARMEEDIRGYIAEIMRLAEEIEKRMPEITEEYAKKLKARMTELLGDFTVDESRLLTEVGIMADRVCVSEEITRLKSHFKEFENIIAQEGPVGRKLDFLIQEINRETNTIASKVSDFGIATITVNMKSEIEKLREQVQNIE